MKPTTLAVEGNEGVEVMIRDLVSETLPDSCSVEAESGEEAEAPAGAQPPHLVLMGVGLLTNTKAINIFMLMSPL
jgi:hypothetical protein